MVRFQDFAIDATRNAVDELLRYAQAVPAERLSWRPSEQARSVLEILQECAVMPLGIVEHLRDRPQAPRDISGYFAQMAQLDAYEKCAQALKANTETLIEAMRAVPESDLNQQVMMPWGLSYSLAQLMFLHYWNLTYHLGQVAYIQLLYGDTNFY
ncbi:MAG: hypothetical protein C4336_05105 [Armatimonadota bacterium]